MKGARGCAPFCYSELVMANSLTARGDRFLSSFLAIDTSEYQGVNRWLLKSGQILAVSLKDFLADRCLLQASALSFTTILSLVPFLALAFAVLKGFGVQNRLEPLLLQQVTAGSEKAVFKIIQYINNTKVATLGAAGLISLVITAISLLDSIEEAFNDIWGVRETRSFYRKFTDYLSVALVAPILMISATSITTSLQSQSLVRWALSTPYFGDMLLRLFHFVPYMSIWLALILFYAFIPNTRVSFRSAFVGGVLAGTIWQLAQWCYIHFQMGLTRYNAIYGTLALVPMIMVWIYTTWVIVLFGGEVVWAHQTLRNCRRGLRLKPNHALHEDLALSIFMLIGKRFMVGEPAYTSEELAERLDVPTRTVRDLLYFYVDRGFLVEGGGDVVNYLPARDIGCMRVSDLLSALREYGGEGWKVSHLVDGDKVQLVLDSVSAGREKALSGLTVRGLGGLVSLEASGAGWADIDPPTLTKDQ